MGTVTMQPEWVAKDIARVVGSKQFHVIEGVFFSYDVPQESMDKRLAGPWPPLVDEISRYQLKTWLVLTYGPTIMDQITGIISEIADPTEKALAQIAWESAAVVQIAHPLTVQFAEALGLDSEQIAAAFEAASKIV